MKNLQNRWHEFKRVLARIIATTKESQFVVEAMRTNRSATKTCRICPDVE